ncbi:tetratricopeptide repeat protein [Actinocrispum wychmicini]|uniref:OmpA family protein n=1 Tax=Actinocrispum wychmicini TaxID=1213861 RepID=A0A4R2IJ20_9PSEU|nr:OmpA family protein [Actinocrispum wychmicini]TCO44206.1 OmpA family protein [Actinocrispum wychmicini]
MNQPVTFAFTEELRRAEAAELARAGDLDAAARVLSALPDPASQDLLARVHAQRGDLATADTTWRQILAADPRNSSALAGTRLIADITAGKRRKHPFPAFAVGTGVAAAVVVAGAAALIALPGNDNTVANAQPSVVTPQVQTVTAAPSSESKPQNQAPSQSLVDELRTPGVRVAPNGNQISVVFDDGLFAPNGSQLTAVGRRRLTEWGRLLTGRNVKVTVLGHGLALGPGPATGGSAVAMDRAATAAQALADASGLPMTAFTAMSADQSAAPHLGTTPEKNRTVTLLVTPAQ